MGSELHVFDLMVSVVVAPQGQKTAATMNPGLAYVGTYHQFAVEAIVPLNSEGR
jgi:hypothetical protein